MTNYTTLDTNLGTMTFIERDGAIIALNIGTPPPDAKYADTPLLCAATIQMKEYLTGYRKKFDLPIAPVGTEFQMNIWNALTQIPYGKTISYAKLAENIGHPRAVRAAGNANGRNPIPIIIPCHRVIASNGNIGGFSLGLDLKRKLLAIESD
ncbi:MAG: methylated-DNA--[protein]-cysteine S-methyltransferase [Alphaproteobacteria bacterium]|nr:methylated-DNA--[protein]-cysteine S-methyltransferase [Alphaproteobacteria bacterium]